MSLIVEGLTIDHGAIRAINNVSFKVAQGQLAAIIGANGAGKTTLLRTFIITNHHILKDCQLWK